MKLSPHPADWGFCLITGHPIPEKQPEKQKEEKMTKYLRVTLDVPIDYSIWGLDEEESLLWFERDVLPNLLVFWKSEEFLSEEVSSLCDWSYVEYED